jgi:hypothetical protein
MKLGQSVLALLAIATLLLLSGCSFFWDTTPTVVSVEYYGHNSFKLGYTGEWSSDLSVSPQVLFEKVFVKSKNADKYYTIIDTEQAGMASSFKTNYEIIIVDRDWTPGNTIIVSHTEKHEFQVPDTQ